MGFHRKCDVWGGGGSDRDLTSLTLIHLTLLMDVTVTRKVASALLLFSCLEKSPA